MTEYTKERFLAVLSDFTAAVTRDEREDRILMRNAVRQLLEFAVEIAPSQADVERQKRLESALAPFAGSFTKGAPNDTE